MSNTIYEGMTEFINERLKEGLEAPDIYEMVRRKFKTNSSRKSLLSRIYQQRKKLKTIPKQKSKPILISKNLSQDFSDDEIESFLNLIRKSKVINFIDLCNIFDYPPKKVLALIEECKFLGFDIFVDCNKIIFNVENVASAEVIRKPLVGGKNIVFGVASDLHFGSKATQITALLKFCEIAKKRGVKHIFVPGDVLAGYDVYRGQVFDLYAVQSQEQTDSVLANLPEGFEWYLLGGNHDYSFIKKGGGHNPLMVLSRERSDIHYVGFDEATVPLMNNVDLMMWHPSGGIPYSVSYRIQKAIEQIAFSELLKVTRGIKDKPSVRFLLSGHLHIQVQALFGSIYGMQCGAFEGQTNYLRRKGIIPAIGGYVVEAELGTDGSLKNFLPKFYVFEEIEDDWKNFKHSFNSNVGDITKPIFE